MIVFSRVRVLLVFAVLVVSPAASRAAIILEARLTGSQENPPVATTATGFGRFVLNDAQTSLSFEIRLSGIDFSRVNPNGTVIDQSTATGNQLVAIHLHRGPVGTNGPVIFGFVGTPNNDLNGDTVVDAANGIIRGKWDLNEGNGNFGTPPVPTTLANQLPFLLSGGVYVNVHTGANRGGEIRGQLFVVPEPATFGLFAVAGAGLLAARRRRVG